MTIKTDLRDISPIDAAELLARNTRNRPLDIRKATSIAGAITRGEWMVNGATIRMDKNGVLLDGQHRLTAIVISGKTVQTLFVTGLEPETFLTIDVNQKSRTTADVLAIGGVKHYSIVAAIARLVFTYEKCGNPVNGSPENAPTVQQSNDLALGRAGIQESASRASMSKWCKKFITPSLCGFCSYIFAKKDAAHAEAFMGQLESGQGLEDGSPILLLRERLMNSAGDKDSLKRAYKAALIFKAFRLYMDGAHVKILRVRTVGDSPEKDLFIL